MRLATLAILVALLGGTGLALAQAPGGSHEEAKTPVPLTVYDAQGKAHTYFLKCGNNSRDLATCSAMSVWEDVNPLAGLQTSKVFVGRWHEPDHRMLA